MKKVKEQAVKNAVASAEMEGIHPTAEDIDRIVDYVEKKNTYDEFVTLVPADVQGVKAS